MAPWLETAAVTTLAVLATVVGLGLSRLRSPWWLVGYFVPLVLLLLVTLARNIDALRFAPVFSTISAGRNEFTLLAIAVPMLLTLLIGRLGRLQAKVLMAGLVVICMVQLIVYPFLVPALIRDTLCHLPNNISPDGVCMQSTDYTCGPAAAVTALAQLGVDASEGQIAIDARSAPQMGTPDDMLAAAVEKRYGNRGIRCEYRHFDSVEQLKPVCPTIAVVKFAFLTDHYVTVLDVNDGTITVADPLEGRRTLTHADFKRKWRSVGIVIEGTSTIGTVVETAQ